MVPVSRAPPSALKAGEEAAFPTSGELPLSLFSPPTNGPTHYHSTKTTEYTVGQNDTLHLTSPSPSRTQSNHTPIPSPPHPTMAEDRQPASLVEGAGTGDLEDELPDAAAKSAEDRKAAAALAKLDDTRGDDDDARGADAADREAASKAVQGLGGKAAPAAEVKKVKVDAADVALLVRVWASEGRGGGERAGGTGGLVCADRRTRRSTSWTWPSPRRRSCLRRTTATRSARCGRLLRRGERVGGWCCGRRGHAYLDVAGSTASRVLWLEHG